MNSQPSVPCHGKRNSLKVYGAVCPATCQFDYRIQKHYFDSDDYLYYLETSLAPAFYRKGHKIYVIQDNASYHKTCDVNDWAATYSKYIELIPLPPYSPQFNAAEKVWKYTRKKGTHNVYFESEDDLRSTLSKTLRGIKRRSDVLRGYMQPFV